MYCKKCGMENRDDARFCWNCGTYLAEQKDNQNYQQRNFSHDPYNRDQYNGNSYDRNSYNQNNYGNDPFYNPYNPYAYPVPRPQDPAKGFAIASFVLGLVSIIVAAFIAGPLAIIFGSVARGKGSRSPLAILGIIFGAIGLAAVILMFVACPETLTGYMY